MNLGFQVAGTVRDRHQACISSSHPHGLHVAGPRQVHGERTANHTVGSAEWASLEFGGSVFGEPGCGSELGDALYGGVGKPRQDIGEVIADGYVEPATAFDHGDDGGYSRSGLLAPDMDPVASATAMGLIEFSARLLLSSSSAYSRKLISRFHMPERISAAFACSALG